MNNDDYEDVEVPVWRGVVASPEMSDEAVAYYSEILKKVSDSEDGRRITLIRIKLFLIIWMQLQQSNI